MQNKIKHYRKQLRLSQEELSVKSNVSRATISGLESGRILITKTGTLEKIADALNKKVSEILFD